MVSTAMLSTIQPHEKSGGESRLQAGALAWTARELADKLGLSKQAVKKELARLAGNGGTRIVKGQRAPVWTLAALPGRWQGRLEALAQRKGYRTPEAYLLDHEDVAWQPARSFGELREDFRLEAEQWREVLLPLLTGQHARPSGEWLRIGLEACRRVFGRELSEDTLRRRFDLANERDRGFEDFGRLDLYVNEAAYTQAFLDHDHAEIRQWQAGLAAEFERFKTPGKLTRAERFAVFRLLFPLAESEAVADLCRFALERLPGLSRSARALARNFRRCLAVWRENGCQDFAAAPQKPRGRRKQQLCEPCAALMKGAAGELTGNFADAWRRLMTGPEMGGIREKGEGICDECVGKWKYNPRIDRNYVPKAVVEQCWPDVASALPWKRGAKTAYQQSPFTPGNPDDIGPGDVIEGDDVTLNHVIYIYDKIEDGRPYVGRPETLMFIDRRTWYPLGHVTIFGSTDMDGKQKAARYTGTDIRLGVLHVHDQWGLPHLRFLFERGTWDSRLVSGRKVKGFDGLACDDEYERGLNEEGIQLSGGGVAHARAGNPRRKIIERVFNEVQMQMQALPGYVGRNHRDYNPEDVNWALAQCKKAGANPADYFLSAAQFRDLFDKALMDFARTPLTGKYHRGLSPMEAFHNGVGGHPGIKDRPMRQLPQAMRWKLATHQRMVDVTARGIIFQVGGKQLVFWGDALLPYKHKKLLCRWNLEAPDLLHCMPEGAEPFTVRRKELQSFTAAPGDQRRVESEKRRWVQQGKTICDALPKPLSSHVVFDNETSEEGREIGKHIAQVVAERKQEKAEAARAENLRKSLKLPEKMTPRQVERAAQARARVLAAPLYTDCHETD